MNEHVIEARRRWIPYCCFTPLKIIRAHMNRHWLESELKRREVNRNFAILGGELRGAQARPSGRRLILAK